MFLIKNENVEHWLQHNIRISELKDSTSIMSQPGSTKKLIHLPRVRMLSRGRPTSGIRITNVKSIKPPDPEMVKKHEEDRLRAQLHKEIEEKSRLCANTQYECTLPVLVGRRHCARHILQDPEAPFRRCAHLYSGGERCAQPAPTTAQGVPAAREHGLCFEHARAAMLARQRSQAPPPAVASTETYLNQLQHYVRPERTRTTSCASSVSVVSDPAEQDPGVPHAVDPFKQIDAISVNASVTTSLMECNSASESDADSVTLGRAGDCRGGADEDLSEGEEPELTMAHGHAGIFTAEEAVCEAKNALKQLQSSYVRQMGRLRTLLYAARYDYVKALKAEKEQYCSINRQARTGPVTARERRQLRKLKAYASYHRRHGAAAVAQRRLHRKRAKALETPSPVPRALPSAVRCTFAEGGVRCAGPALPAARHCARHVVHDTQQVLFVPCGDCRGGVSCREPVARLPLPSAACRYHTSPPAYTSYSLKKEDSAASNTETESASDYSGNEAERYFEERTTSVVATPPVTQAEA